MLSDLEAIAQHGQIRIADHGLRAEARDQRPLAVELSVVALGHGALDSLWDARYLHYFTATTEEICYHSRVLDTPLEVVARIRAHLPGLQAADARVARVVLDQPEVVIHRSAAEVGELAGTSAATVVRCAQKLGFKGFHDLKLSLAQELPAFSRDEPGASALARVTRAGARRSATPGRSSTPRPSRRR